MPKMQNADHPSWDEGRQWQAAVHATTGLLRICSFPDLFNAAAQNLAELLDADGAALIVTEEPNRVRYRLFHGLERLNQKPIVKFSFPAGQGTVGQVLATGTLSFHPGLSGQRQCDAGIRLCRPAREFGSALARPQRRCRGDCHCLAAARP